MAKTHTVIIQLNKELSVELKGTYYGGYIGSWEQPPEDAEFEVEKVELHTGSVNDLLEYVDSLSREKGIYEHLSDKAVEQIQQDEYENKMDIY